MNQNVLYNLNHIQIWQTRTCNEKESLWKQNDIKTDATENKKLESWIIVYFKIHEKQMWWRHALLLLYKLFCFPPRIGMTWSGGYVYVLNVWIQSMSCLKNNILLCEHVWFPQSLARDGHRDARLEKPPHVTTSVSSISSLGRFISLFIASLWSLLGAARGQASRRPCLSSCIISKLTRWAS